MGVLYDYFIAVDDADAVKIVDDLDGGPIVVAGGRPGIHAIDLKGIDPVVTLGQLVAFVRGVEWNVGMVDGNLLWSRDEQNGPWLTPIGDGARDTLASITEAQMPELSARWGRIEELAGENPLPEGQLLPVIGEITALAQLARDTGRQLYCWCSL